MDALTSNPQDHSWGTDTKKEPTSKADRGFMDDTVVKANKEPVNNDEEPAAYTEEEALEEPESVPTEGRLTPKQPTAEEQMGHHSPAGGHTEVLVSQCPALG